MRRDIPPFLQPPEAPKPERLPSHRQVIAASLAYEYSIGSVTELPPALALVAAMRAALVAAMREDL